MIVCLSGQSNSMNLFSRGSLDSFLENDCQFYLLFSFFTYLCEERRYYAKDAAVVDAGDLDKVDRRDGQGQAQPDPTQQAA